MEEFFLVLGVVLVLAELFVPGGILGTIGFIAIVFSLMAITESLGGMLLALGLTIGLILILVYVLYKVVPKDKFRNTLILKSTLNKDEGYISSQDLNSYIGKIGKTKSVLRPSGKIVVEGVIIDAVSQDVFIEAQKNVEIIFVDGTKVVVRERKDV